MDSPDKAERATFSKHTKEKGGRKHKKEARKSSKANAGDLSVLIVGGGSDIGPKLVSALENALSVSWTDVSINTFARDPRPQLFIGKQQLSQPRLFLVALDTPRVHLGEGGTGLANSVYGFIYAGIASLNPLRAIFELSEYAVTLAELKRLHRTHGDAFPLQNISYYSHGIGTRVTFNSSSTVLSAVNFTPDPPFLVKIGSSPPGQGCYIVRSHDDISDVRSILALHNHYVTLSVVFPLKRIIRLRTLGDLQASAFECKQIGNMQQWDRIAARPIELTEGFRGWLKLISDNVHGGLHVFGVEAIETDKGRLLIRDVDVRPDLLFPCAQTLENDVATLAKSIRHASAKKR